MADVATGTGAVAMAIAERYGAHVTGIDQSAEMLAGARERVAAAGLDEPRRAGRGQAEALPLEDGAVDALTHTYLLRYVDDPPATLRELAARSAPAA